MPDGKKSGGLFDRLKSELFEDDGATKPAPHSTAAPASIPQAPAAPPPVISGTTAYTFGTGPTPQAIDADALKAVTDGVFAVETNYTHFMSMYETLGRPADASVALKAMQAMDKSVTPAAILKDIGVHLARLDDVTTKANSDFDAVTKDRLGGADQTLAGLNQANETATAEIARHQHETADRIVQISQITQQRAADEAAIAQAKARTEAAETSVKQQLLSMQSLFGTLQ